ncbi:regulator of G protein signaling domain-containing protein [Lipomyces doorenjongii]|uniref:regulator of G protein signaling domain-containing protein n=1 Tax=Lipomyces doorenjongii TaxID=383834 RepID=UPI0034CDB585
MLLQAARLLRCTEEGRPFYDEFTAVFATLISSLPLQPHTVGLFHARYDFSFSSMEAARNLAELKLQQQNKTIDLTGRLITSTTITTYQIDVRSCAELMQLFLNARLIRCANDPEQGKFKHEMLFQLTPKGIAIVDAFSQRHGVVSPNVVDLLKSQHNSMKLVHLERDPVTDHISSSEIVIEIIFQRFAGRKPNTTPLHRAHSHHMPSQSLGHSESSDTDVSSVSDMYLESSAGVHVHDSKRIHLKEYHNCFSGMAAKLWLMDCTSIIYALEAQMVLTAFLQYDLITPADARSMSSGDKFLMEKNAYYYMSEKGKNLAGWPTTGSGLLKHGPHRPRSPGSTPYRYSSSAARDKHSRLEHILEDPALRLLFREHLAENFCDENLTFYLESERLLAQFHELEKNQFPTLEKVNVCLSEAWVVYHAFLAPGSASEVNIDHLLRQRVRERMTAEELDTIATPGSQPIESISMSVTKLTEIVKLLDDVRRQVFRLMASDSVPKFMRTARFWELGIEV